ncbi:hypothetical protein CLV79_11231 [Limimaricola soesokkakensis]|uniref:1,4-alpha-glucan branching enzyme n=1 Tax=Limimaricola soesokkakensis TaxID=1343159 RepID=A0A1X6ZYU0_9RHOB|nr:hypothetical protein [Limimaricola soesokkakensis]PSK82515.1 hypothetical protein CLV79_11231 [Limimaricola soesokkakensis]SLN65567.1 hypothetical protein LOS8367_03228 [Limimaricola soesokkakensis]
MSDAKTTTDHDEIREWCEARGGHPARVSDTADKREGGILRIDFEPSAEGLERIDWDDWFAIFEESKLAFLHQDRAADGAASRFNKLVSRD